MTAILKTSVWLAIGALLVSCAMPGDRDSLPLEAEMPAAWTAGTGPKGAVRADWWTSFDDPALEALVLEALEHNQDLQQAAARIEGATAVARIAGADRLPQASVGGRAARGRAPFLGDPVTQNELGVSFSIGWEVDVWGRLRSGQLAAIKDLEVVRAQHAAARLSLAARTVKARFAVEEARRQRDLARTTVTNYTRSLGVIRDRFRRGVASPLEVRLASTNLAAARALESTRLEQFDAAVRCLEVLLGRYPSRELALEPCLPPLPGPVPAGLPSELLQRRPDIVAARHRVCAADARLFGAKAALLPRLSLTASGGTASSELADLFTGSSLLWTLAGNLLQPVFQGGRLSAQVDLESARVREALAAFRSTALEAFREVECALAAERHLEEREIQLAEAARHAAEARRLAEERIETGTGTILLLLEAQRRELDAESLLLSVRRARLDNRVNLHLALGGPF